MKNLISLIALTLCLCFAASAEMQAQNYKSAAGLRLGYPWAASYKTFISESSAIEAYASYRGFSGWGWFGINGAFQIHNDLDLGDIDGLQYYYGAGAGIQFWSSSFSDSNGTFFNVSGYLGLEYTFEDAPISITADWVPTFFIGDGFGGFGGFRGGYGGLGVRYVLNSGSK